MQQEVYEGCGTSFWKWFFFRNWLPFYRVWHIVLLYGVIGVIFAVMAITTYLLYSNAQSFSVVYSESMVCTTTQKDNSVCSELLELPNDLQPPILFMYVIYKAYINHRKVLNSWSIEQLQGTVIDLKTADKYCTPSVFNENIDANKSYGGKQLEPQSIASPCGFLRIVFNDTFEMHDAEGKEIFLNESGISLDLKKYNKYNRQADSKDVQWIDPYDEHFQVWMYSQAMYTKYKLWARIDQVLPKGKYTISARNNFMIDDMPLVKSVYLNSPSKIGGRIMLFPLFFTIVSQISFAIALGFWCKLGQYDEIMSEKIVSNEAI